MPLYPHTVTAASRIMLPTYFLLYMMIGFALLFQRPQRTDSPHYDVPKMMAGGDIRPWGLLFIASAVMMVVALALHQRRLEQWVLAAAAALPGFWGSLFVLEGFSHPDVSFTAGLFILGWVPALIATVSSLDRNEAN